MPARRRGPGRTFVYSPERDIPRLYAETGMDCERLAYDTNMEAYVVRSHLGKRIDRAREAAATEEIERRAWKLVVTKQVDFYEARDRIQVHASTLRRVLSELFKRNGRVDLSWDLYRDSHDYAMKVYRESRLCLWDVAWALECKDQEARVALGHDYDPYADYRRDTEAEEKARELHDKGMSYKQIDWILRSHEIDSESMLEPRPPHPVKARIARDYKERFEAGERLPKLGAEDGLDDWKAQGYLWGLYEHPLDLYGMGRPERDEVGRLYMDEGYCAEEISGVTGFRAREVKWCIDEFFCAEEDEDRHWASVDGRASSGDDGWVATPPEEEPDPEGDARRRRERSAKSATEFGIDEGEAAEYFEDGLVPTDCELLGSRDARSRLAKAMWHQGKSLEEMSEATGVAAKTVEKYLGEEYRIAQEKAAGPIPEADPGDVAAALYADGMGIDDACEEAGCSRQTGRNRLVDYARWRHPFADYSTAWGCEARRLISEEGLSLAGTAARLGASIGHVRRCLGTFGTPDAGPLDMGDHATAVYLSDGLHMGDEDIACALGLDRGDVSRALSDGRERSEWARRRQWYGSDLRSEDVAEAFGLGKELVEQASRVGILDPSADRWSSGHLCDPLAVLRVLGIVSGAEAAKKGA